MKPFALARISGRLGPALFGTGRDLLGRAFLPLVAAGASGLRRGCFGMGFQYVLMPSVSKNFSFANPRGFS
jgi:hypothetical protein